MRTDDLDFHLPAELIAQSPAAERSASRLLHYRRSDRAIAHRTFADLPSLLRRGDLLVFNDARVVPARFTLQKKTGGRVEGLFLGEDAAGEWRVLLKNLRRGDDHPLHFADAPDVAVRVIERREAGEVRLAVGSDEPALVLLSRIGRMPLPPYIKREKDHDSRDVADRERYQTVYAREPGAVAAPTAGLHFTDDLMTQLDAAGVEKTFVTLHVGLGTFRPVSAETLDTHVMHAESYTISADAAATLNRAKQDGRRIIAVGTTSARVLESQPADAAFAAKTDQTSIFIYPPYGWRHVSAMITNFHLPKSTLIAMIAAMVGLDEQRRIYATAIAERYRFFSYGDAMLIE
ncbi:MAG: S-adenosylmethionine:tRNA ribosyltransferase-isomerase [Phycisphaerales bacterium]|nr:S-adenosylmethionine:tRNA ribosyltransferase-isomerase [Phycisphaerales bacterium]